MLAWTTSAPWEASAFALSLLGSRVIARAANPPLGSLKIARTRPPPCEPVEPTTAMIFLSATFSPLFSVGPTVRVYRYTASRPFTAGRSPHAHFSGLQFLFAHDFFAHDLCAVSQCL